MSKLFYSFLQEDGRAVLDIEGEICSSGFEAWWNDGVDARAFKRKLDALAGEDLTVRINSPGGDVFAGAAIYTMLAGYPGSVRVVVTGLAASAASVIAMAGDEVLMSPVAYMMIHNPWTVAMGDQREMAHQAQVLSELTEGLIAAYQHKTGIDREELVGMLDAETYMSAQTAVDLGFADAVLFEARSDEDDDGEDDEETVEAPRTQMMASRWGRAAVMAALSRGSGDPDPEEKASETAWRAELRWRAGLAADAAEMIDDCEEGEYR